MTLQRQIGNAAVSSLVAQRQDDGSLATGSPIVDGQTISGSDFSLKEGNVGFTDSSGNRVVGKDVVLFGDVVVTVHAVH